MAKQAGAVAAGLRIDQPKREGDAQFEGWGLKLPLPRWALYCVAALVVAAIAFTLYAKVVAPFFDQRNTAQYQEYQKHFGETPRSVQTLFDNDDLGALTVAFYSSDRCLLVTRKVAGAKGAAVPHWILADSIEREPSPGRIVAALVRPVGGLSAPLLAAAGLPALPAQACKGRCVNPHAGEFNSWNGETRGCWVQVFRRWPDGCQHYQWFNKCGGYWDSDQNGPKVFWTCCSH